MSNIEKFDEIAYKLLSYLGATFPIPSNVGLASLGLKTSVEGTSNPVTEVTVGGEPQTEDEKYFNPTVAWLEQAGYIYAETKSGNSLVLTEKGLNLLGIAPKALTVK
ncbi:hypothetical protein [Pseudomonas fluorescens]|uniref:Restriction system protein Mrr-like N-terminal domain-containing protein n=1 Tax=Pseudomonas fluorescens TaxID=294 RepID=A0A5E7EBD7_PSEFL|nr:hypothetical protein [Pseudomonas fluorescens]VVO24261.1 hypothetical protein PS710_04494 [Pseudomonas fluorescens]